MLPSKLANLTAQSSSETAKSTAPASSGKASGLPAEPFEMKAQPQLNLQDIEEDQFLFQCPEGGPLDLGDAYEADQMPHDEMMDQRFFTKE